MQYLLVIVVIAAGVAAIVAGGADDSPGLQGLGVALVLGASWFAVRGARRRR